MFGSAVNNKGKTERNKKLKKVRAYSLYLQMGIT